MDTKRRKLCGRGAGKVTWLELMSYVTTWWYERSIQYWASLSGEERRGSPFQPFGEIATFAVLFHATRSVVGHEKHSKMNGILLQKLTKIRLPLLRAFIFCGLNNICTSCSQTLKFVCTFMTEINVKKRWHVRFHEFAHGLQHFSIVMQDSTKLKKVPLCKMTLCTITEDRHSFGSPRLSCPCFNDAVNYLIVQWLASRHYVFRCSWSHWICCLDWGNHLISHCRVVISSSSILPSYNLPISKRSCNCFLQHKGSD